MHNFNSFFFFFTLSYSMFDMEKASLFAVYILLLPLIIKGITNSIRDILLYLHAIGLTCMVYHLLQQILSGSKPFKATDKKEEMYGLRHILLNIQLPPSTLWFNMGLWTDNVSSFSDACSKLVLETAKYTRIQNGNSVLGKWLVLYGHYSVIELL